MYLDSECYVETRALARWVWNRMREALDDDDICIEKVCVQARSAGS
jgi:hypothetical protein